MGVSKQAAALRLGAIVVATTMAAQAMAFDIMDPTSWFGGEKYETKIIPDVPADQIYDQGLARLKINDYENASKRFGELDKNYPYSQWQKKGMLMQTFSEYQAGKYDDAIASAQRYVGKYPTAPDVPYAYYLQAMSYYNQIPDISHDQESAAKAAATFQQIVEKFPKSEYAEDSRYKLQVTRDQLAGKEMSVGRYYLTRKMYTAAINRFREVLFKYQTTRHAEEALMRLTEAYLALGITNEAQTAAAVLGHNYPDSPWYKDAFAQLQGEGLSPNEDKGSWISRTFKKIGVG